MKITNAGSLHEHWTKKRGKLVEKVKFNTLHDAVLHMETHFIDFNIYTLYKCSICNKWHLGHKL